MAPKPNTNKWSDVQLAIAAISMTSVIAFWNMFAGPDKVKADQKAAEQQADLIPPTVMPVVLEPTAAPSVTMPPIGYTILFGGKAPQPKVVVVQKPKGGGGGGNADSGNGGGGGGGGNAPASQPSTSTTSS